MRLNVGMIAAGAVLLCFGGCASGGSASKPLTSDDVLKGGQYLEPWLGAALKEAERHPLGSEENPVRADMPGGQRAYLARLRCMNDAPPTYERVGNLGAGVFGSIVDQYDVRCVGSHPARTIVVMDMYFRGYAETRAIKGFKIAPP